MNWLRDENALKREVLRTLLNTLPDDLPGIAAARQSAAAGLDFSAALRQAWEQFTRQVAHERSQLQDLRQEKSLLEQTLAVYRRDPAVRERDALRQQVASLATQVEQARQELAGLLETHQRYKQYSQQEISRLQEQIAEQNRILARQQLLLNDQNDTQA